MRKGLFFVERQKHRNDEGHKDEGHKDDEKELLNSLDSGGFSSQPFWMENINQLRANLYLSERFSRFLKIFSTATSVSSFFKIL